MCRSLRRQRSDASADVGCRGGRYFIVSARHADSYCSSSGSIHTAPNRDPAANGDRQHGYDDDRDTGGRWNRSLGRRRNRRAGLVVKKATRVIQEFLKQQ